MTKTDCFFFKRMGGIYPICDYSKRYDENYYDDEPDCECCPFFFSKEKAFDIIQTIVLRQTEKREEN